LGSVSKIVPEAGLPGAYNFPLCQYSSVVTVNDVEQKFHFITSALYPPDAADYQLKSTEISI